MFKAINMHEIRDDCIIMYSLNEVFLEKAHSYYSDYFNTPGTLYLTEYLDTRVRFFEWKPTIINVQVDEDWSIVSRQDGVSHSSPVEELPSKHIKIEIHEIKQYWVNNNMSKFKLMGENDVLLCALSHKTKTFSILYDALNSLLLTTRDHADTNLHNVMDVFEDSADIYRTFLDLEMFLDPESSSTLWQFMRGFQNIPVITIEDCFGKIGLTFDIKSRPDSDEESELDGEIPNIMLDSVSFNLPDGESDLFVSNRPFTLNEFCGPLDLIKKRILEGGIATVHRSIMWKHLLEVYSWPMTREQRRIVDDNNIITYTLLTDYFSKMKTQDFNNYKGVMSRMATFDKEINQSNNDWAKVTRLTCNQLHDIMKCFLVYNHDLGYMYGISDILLPILHVMENQSSSYYSLIQFTQKYRKNFNVYETDLRFQLKELYYILKVVDPDYAFFFKLKHCEHMYFCMRWLWLFFVKEFDENEILKVWEVLLLDLPCKNFQLIIAIAILRSQRNYVIENELDFLQILKHFNTLKGTLNVMEIIQESRRIYLKLRNIFKDPQKLQNIKRRHLADLDDSNDSIVRDLMAAHILEKNIIVE